jgi:hypothetical protein
VLGSRDLFRLRAGAILISNSGFGAGASMIMLLPGTMRSLNPQVMSMRELEPVDDLLNRAFELAYFILGDRSAAIYVAMAAMDKVKTALGNQGRRLYYTPTGRSAYPAARTKVNLSELHLLQRLVYIESELFERLLEGQRKTIHQEDLIIRYIKHLIRITTKHNSFYVTLGMCRLLYNYTTGDTSEVYNLVLQDPERIRDDYYYRSRKKRLMEEIKQRFGNLVRVQRGLRREDRFQPQENSQEYAGLVRECLTRFTPWQSACVLPEELDPNRNVIASLLFEGKDPDSEHEVELNRMHTLIHPECLARLTAALGLDSPDQRLELPLFLVSHDGSRPSQDRFCPAELTEGELDAVGRYLDKGRVHRKQFSQAQLRLLVDGRRQADFQLQPSQSVEFDLEEGSELIEIRSAGSIEEDDDTSLAVCLLKYDQSGVTRIDSSIAFGKSRRLALKVLPLAAASGEAHGGLLKLTYESSPARNVFTPVELFRTGRNTFVEYLWRSGRPLKPALTFLFVVTCAIGLWLFFHSGRNRSNPSQVATLQENRGVDTPSLLRPPVPPGKNGTESPSTINRQQERNSSGTSSSVRPLPANGASGLNRVRGTKPRPASPVLLAVKRVYVDPLGDDSFSRQLREELIDGLQASNRFEIVRDRNEADAVFKGSAKEGREPGSKSAVVLELINASGQTVWSLSSRRDGRSLSNDAAGASGEVLKILLDDIKGLERHR